MHHPQCWPQRKARAQREQLLYHFLSSPPCLSQLMMGHRSMHLLGNLYHQTVHTYSSWRAASPVALFSLSYVYSHSHSFLLHWQYVQLTLLSCKNLETEFGHASLVPRSTRKWCLDVYPALGLCSCLPTFWAANQNGKYILKLSKWWEIIFFTLYYCMKCYWLQDNSSGLLAWIHI